MTGIMNITDPKKTNSAPRDRQNDENRESSPADGRGTAGIDMETALERLGGRRDIYMRMLAQFSPTYGNACVLLRQYIDRRDAKSAYRLAHNIKSAAAGIGLLRLSEASQRLETAIFHQKDTVDEYCAYFSDTLDEALRMIAAALESPPSSGRRVPPVSKQTHRPPTPVLENIAGYARRGEYTRLDTTLSILEREHPEYRDFCAVIRFHAGHYNDEAIVTYAEQED